MNAEKTSVSDTVITHINDLLPGLESFYTDVHAHPELSMQETRTAGLAAERLRANGFDVTTGMKDNIAYINDRNGQLKDLEKRKVDLQKQLDELQDEGRKAGAPASWFR